ncbi:hypothetical protein [Dactylosporangium sp. CA-139066]|uniref:hypothetical protein n=1 Tax=Dactylosporangium sp. CA-139066 TaxID=3239930 RepID=UPI003D8F68D2
MNVMVVGTAATVALPIIGGLLNYLRIRERHRAQAAVERTRADASATIVQHAADGLTVIRYAPNGQLTVIRASGDVARGAAVADLTPERR